jgi:TRAP-type C4-dicarboxylate transport system substrate-binding protein
MLLRLLALSVALLCATEGAAQTVLTASQQFIGGKDDPREEVLGILARKVAAANAGIEIKTVSPGSLGGEVWTALSADKLDIASVAADSVIGAPLALRVTLLPGLAHDHAHAARLNHSPFAAMLKADIEKTGAMVLAGAWFAGALGSTKGCIRSPADLRGLRMRPSAPVYAQFWEQAGASIVSSPSAELYRSLQGGSIDAVDMSSAGFLSFRLYERMKCLTLPGRTALWFSYQPVLMSKARFAKLTKPQQEALLGAAHDAESEFEKLARRIDDDLAAKAKAAGVQTVTLTPSAFDIWLTAARDSVYRRTVEDEPAAKALIDAAAAVK